MITQVEGQECNPHVNAIVVDDRIYTCVTEWEPQSNGTSTLADTHLMQDKIYRLENYVGALVTILLCMILVMLFRWLDKQ